jgi:hypothetical protein
MASVFAYRLPRGIAFIFASLAYLSQAAIARTSSSRSTSERKDSVVRRSSGWIEPGSVIRRVNEKTVLQVDGKADVVALRALTDATSDVNASGKGGVYSVDAAGRAQSHVESQVDTLLEIGGLSVRSEQSMIQLKNLVDACKKDEECNSTSLQSIIVDQLIPEITSMHNDTLRQIESLTTETPKTPREVTSTREELETEYQSHKTCREEQFSITEERPHAWQIWSISRLQSTLLAMFQIPRSPVR